MATTSSAAGTVTREELMRRASKLLPVLKERSAETERLRQIPRATVNDLVSAGFMRLANPDRYGGLGFEIDTMFEVAMELGRVCGSTGWCYGVWQIHNWVTGYFPEQAQEEYFSVALDAISSSAYNPSGRMEPVEGGYRLSGRWQFSSGSDYAAWATIGAMGPGGGGPFWILIPSTDFRVDDTWFVSGLRGTGSKDVVVEDAFVPAHRVVEMLRLGRDKLDGWELHGRTSYRLPVSGLLGHSLSSPLVGIGQGAVDEFLARLSGTSGRGRTAESVALQLRLAEASAEVDLARTMIRGDSSEMLARASRGEQLSDLDLARHRRNLTYLGRLCVSAVNRLFDASGGHALFDSHPMQRFHRDAHAVTHHTAFNWDAAAEAYGRGALGLPIEPR